MCGAEDKLQGRAMLMHAARRCDETRNGGKTRTFGKASEEALATFEREAAEAKTSAAPPEEEQWAAEWGDRAAKDEAREAREARETNKAAKAAAGRAKGANARAPGGAAKAAKAAAQSAAEAAKRARLAADAAEAAANANADGAEIAASDSEHDDVADLLLSMSEAPPPKRDAAAKRKAAEAERDAEAKRRARDAARPAAADAAPAAYADHQLGPGAGAQPAAPSFDAAGPGGFGGFPAHGAAAFGGFAGAHPPGMPPDYAARLAMTYQAFAANFGAAAFQAPAFQAAAAAQAAQAAQAASGAAATDAGPPPSAPPPSAPPAPSHAPSFFSGGASGVSLPPAVPPAHANHGAAFGAQAAVNPAAVNPPPNPAGFDQHSAHVFAEQQILAYAVANQDGFRMMIQQNPALLHNQTVKNIYLALTNARGAGGDAGGTQ